MTQEKQASPIESSASSGGLGNIFDQPDSGGLATVVSGPYAERLPIADSSVGEIRRRFQDRFDISPDSQALVDGVEVGDDTVLRADQILRFRHHSGEKGLH